MPIESAPLFRPDVLGPRLAAFALPPEAADWAATLRRWADLLSTPAGRAGKERELLPDFLTDVFLGVLGYTPAVASGGMGRYTLSRERLVEVSGKFADGVLGEFGPGEARSVVAVEGKGPLDPLDRPHAGRKLSAVEQGYGYAINLPCDWIVVTNLREVRLYHKGSTHRFYERFEVAKLAEGGRELRRFVYLLGAERVVPESGLSHLYDLLTASVKAGEEVTQAFYREFAAMRRRLFAALAADNPEVPGATLLSATQKLLDRVLFIAFCEDRGLLPDETLDRAYGHRDPYNPRPIWENFRGLFAAIDEGRAELNIPRYNGGLFAFDAVLDGLRVRDDACRLFKRLGEFNYRVPSAVEQDEEAAGVESRVVDVDILGHIFEQSISDLEQLRADIEAGIPGAPAGPGRVSKRKREGAFYTPPLVTRYIVEEALRPVLAERFERLRAGHAGAAAKSAVRTLADPAVFDLTTLNEPQRWALIGFWEAWLGELQTVRVVDPACGSGAFLIEAFEQLYVEYQRAVDHLISLERGQARVFDPDRTILQSNLYGVDLNEEAIEIARLSVWIKTAQRGKVLTDLDHNIRSGNSVVADPAVHPRAFDWHAAFPEVFADGGFDVVIGNPPYVRAELLTPELKQYFERTYRTYHGAADLYTYFYELGFRILRLGGRLAYIVTNKWLKSGYGRPLREFFVSETHVDSVVDFGHAPIFSDADVFPVILVVRKPSGQPVAPQRTTRVSIYPKDQLGRDVALVVAEHGYDLPATRFTGEAWNVERPGIEELLKKLKVFGRPLREVVGPNAAYGIKTGFNEAFLIDSPTRDALIREHASSAEILKPYLRGQDVRRWSSAWAGVWMIFARRGIDIDAFPAVKRHLAQFRDRLEPKPRGWSADDWGGRKGGAYLWYELQDTVDYWRVFEQPKIIWKDISFNSEFCFDPHGYYTNDLCFVLPTSDLWVLAVLNSPAMWMFLWHTVLHGKTEALRLKSMYMETVPIPLPIEESREAAETRVHRLIAVTQSRQASVAALLDWLNTEFGIDEPGNRLRAPHLLDSDAFVAEAKKHRKAHALTAAELKRLREEYDRSVTPVIAELREAERLEDELSDLVNAAYGLTPDDVTLMWDTAPPRMPGRRPRNPLASAG